MPTCIVVPCYNEARRLPSSDFEIFLAANPQFHILFADDGSTDRTVEVLQSLKRKFPDQVIILARPENSGKAETVREGILEAHKTGRFSFIGFLDADLSAPLQVMKELHAGLSEGERYSGVFASRLNRLGAIVERKYSRHISGRIFATFASVMLRISVYDSQCGAKLFRSGAVPHIFSEKFVSRWFFDLEIILRAGEKNILEIPISEWREKGESKIRFTDFVRAPFDILKIKRKYNR